MVDIESVIKSLRLPGLNEYLVTTQARVEKLPRIHLERFWMSNAF